MNQSIPAAQIVNVTPSVLGASGNALAFNGLFLTDSTQIPFGAVMSFPSAAAVGVQFGLDSPEYQAASIYFLGYDNSLVKPSAILFAQYAWEEAVPAYLIGASGLSLAQVQAASGVLTITINGEAWTSSEITLSGAGSFSAAAGIIQSALAAYDAEFTGAISGTTLTVSAVASGALASGQVLTGTGVTAGTTIVSGSGNSWVVSVSQTVASEAMKAGAAVVSWNSILGAFQITGGTPGAASTIGYASGSIAASLLLTVATGASLSQGAAISTPNAFMETLTDTFTNFVTFSTIFEPDTSDKVAFAGWNNAQNNRYGYIMSDSNSAPTTDDDTSSAGYLITQAGYSGTCPIYDPLYSFKNAFVMGAAASIDFAGTNQRITFAFKSQSGLTADVTSETIAENLIDNGYNFYGAYATAAQGFVFFYPGSVTGKFLWLDSYVNQISLNAGLQLAIMELLTSVPSIPYNTAGDGLIQSAANDPITAASNFGSIVAGVTLSSLQASEVNAAAGLDITGPLFSKGWYLQSKAAQTPAITRQARGSPPIALWYCDGEAVQKIDIASIDIL